MTAKKAPVKVDSLVMRHASAGEPSAEHITGSAVNAYAKMMLDYARMADADAPSLRRIGMAGLRRLAARLLEADPAVRSLRAAKGDEHLHELARYAREVGYPATCTQKAFVLDAMKRFDVKAARTITGWLAEAKEKNLMQ